MEKLLLNQNQQTKSCRIPAPPATVATYKGHHSVSYTPETVEHVLISCSERIRLVALFKDNQSFMLGNSVAFSEPGEQQTMRCKQEHSPEGYQSGCIGRYGHTQLQGRWQKGIEDLQFHWQL